MLRLWAPFDMGNPALEDIIRIMPRWVHDPSKSIRPRELKEELSALAFRVAPLVRMGQVRINHSLEPVFGLLAFTATMYLGHAFKCLHNIWQFFLYYHNPVLSERPGIDAPCQAIRGMRP